MPPTYSYSGDPSTSDLDHVRFLIGDIAAPWKFSNEEISALIAVAGNAAGAAAAALQRWALDIMRNPSFSIGRFSEQYQAAAQQMTAMASTLLAGSLTQDVYAGGISQADREAYEADSDNVPPDFKRTLMEFSRHGT